VAELQAVSFVVWSVITGILFVVAGVSYKTYLKRKKSDPSF
jgi:Tfp pilus assembly protein PilE